MEQNKIWDHFQNDEDAARMVFPEVRQRFMIKRLKLGMAVLNIGVGGGALERLAIKKGVDIYSLDPSEQTIVRLRDELNLGVKAQAGYAQSIPFEDGRFDAIVMSEVLEHLDDKALQESLREILRALKPNGFLLASTPYDENLKASETVCPDCGKVFHKVGHVQSFDKSRIRQIVTEQGLSIENLYITTFVDWQRKGLKNFLKSLLRFSLARLGEKIADPHLIVIARKAASDG